MLKVQELLDESNKSCTVQFYEEGMETKVAAKQLSSFLGPHSELIPTGSSLMKKKLLVIRHGERMDKVDDVRIRNQLSRDIQKNIYHKKDPPLTETGYRQAQEAAKIISSSLLPSFQQSVEMIYTSRLQRCVKTAYALAKELKVPLVLSSGLSRAAAGVSQKGSIEYPFLATCAVKDLCPNIVVIDGDVEFSANFVPRDNWLGALLHICQKSDLSIVVAHQETIKGLTGLKRPVQYCAIAEFDLDFPVVMTEESLCAKFNLRNMLLSTGETDLSWRDIADLHEDTKVSVLSSLTAADGVNQKIPVKSFADVCRTPAVKDRAKTVETEAHAPKIDVEKVVNLISDLEVDNKATLKTGSNRIQKHEAIPVDIVDQNFQPDHRFPLWRDKVRPFFREKDITCLRQIGPTCVSNVLAMITGMTPEDFQKPRNDVNTDDPVSWSDALHPYGFKLAYCPVDCRRLKHFLPELLAHDDLFCLSFYCGHSATKPKCITREPDLTGRIIGSHIILLHRDTIFDPCAGVGCKAIDYNWGGYKLGQLFTKRIFRVVPADYPRGI